MYGRNNNSFNRDAYANNTSNTNKTSNTNTNNYGMYNGNSTDNRVDRYGSYRVTDYQSDKLSPGLADVVIAYK